MSNTENFTPISVATLVAGGSLGIDVYMQCDAESKPVLYYSSDQPYDIEQLEQLVSEQSAKLFIDGSDRDRYQEYLRENCDDLAADPSSSVYDRVSVMSEVVRDVLSKDFASGDTAQIVQSSQNLGGKICNLIRGESLVMNELFRVLHHDYATFTHCTNVSLYCVLLAKELGYDDQDLERIAIGGLLHDLGKLKIDDRILTKPGRLDEFEFDIIKKHPLVGYRDLIQRDDLCEGQMMMVYQHHEKLNGSGYPVGCDGDEIHPWAQICTVVDIYEALTANRPYRRPMETSTALAILEKGKGIEFSPQLIECWCEIVTCGSQE